MDTEDRKDQAKLAQKLLKVMQACAVISKDDQNEKQKYRYVSSDAVLGRVNQALGVNGLVTTCSVEVMDRQIRQTGSGGNWELCTVKVVITIIDTETGASVTSEGIGQGYDGADKSLSKAQTQAKKYAWLLALNVSTGDDPEADEKTDLAQEPAALCKTCKGPAVLISLGEDTLAGPYKEYSCPKCKKVFREKA
jgi:hypothetical protein